MSGSKHGATALSSSSTARQRKPPTNASRKRRPEIILDSDAENNEDQNPKKKMRFDWNAYPETKEFVDGSGLISVADTEEFRAMYNEACRIYMQEGGQDDLGKNRIQNLRFGKVKSSLRHPSLSFEQPDEESWEPTKRSRGLESSVIPPCSPPTPQFKTLLPGEQIDFESFQRGVAGLQDQCQRLMGSLEEARRTTETLTKERDFYQDFWQAMNNYHSVMSRFQVPAPALTAAAFATQFPYSSSSPPVSQVNAPRFAASAYPLYNGTTNLTASELTHDQSQQQEQPCPQPPQQSTIATPVIPDVAPQSQNPILSTTETAAEITQSPETPSKRKSMKSIESYFASMKTVSGRTNTDPAPVSDKLVQHPTNPDLGSSKSPLETPSKQIQPMMSSEVTEMSASPDPPSVPTTDKESGDPGGHKDEDWMASLGS